MKPSSIVFLYTELAGYTLACLKELAGKGVAVHVFNYPVNKEAPFKFKQEEGISFYNRFDFTLTQLSELITKINPVTIVCSGWIDKDYLKICAVWKRKCITVLALDTKWEGLWRQHLATMLSPLMIKSKFSYAWVPGNLQAIYARKLGFSKNAIFTGFYSCDFDNFNQQYRTTKASKTAAFPKRFIYAGRYYNFKGVRDLWHAFMELQTEHPNSWELWCLGTGDIEPIVHPRIKHFGFVQPEAMHEFIANTGVFVLPSHKEPWGVVVHEFAAAGFPLVCSDKVGAAEAFLTNKENGYSFEAGNKNELKNVLLKITQSSDETLLQMGVKSNTRAGKITPANWAGTLMHISENKI